jgi:very-short-patch-repair endonuclease
MPPKRTTAKGNEKARHLRKEPTPAESKLWSFLRNNNLNGVKFRRQHAIGNYIVDFCSPKHKLVVEVDGSQHLEQEEYDTLRTKYLQEQGWRVIRFWNNQVLNDPDGVFLAIALELEQGHTPD